MHVHLIWEFYKDTNVLYLGRSLFIRVQKTRRSVEYGKGPFDRIFDCSDFFIVCAGLSNSLPRKKKNLILIVINYIKLNIIYFNFYLLFQYTC